MLPYKGYTGKWPFVDLTQQEPSPSGNARGQVIDLEPMLDEYYRLRGWDLETGWPTPEKLRELNLEEATPWLNDECPCSAGNIMGDGAR
jgi:aldehyde:ferredoxin oxidoreductase